MQLTKAEENKNRIISATITTVIFALLLLFLLFYNIITPNPPFPEGGGGGGQELALGMMNVGNDNIDYSSMGGVTDVVTQKPETKEEILTDENGEVVPINKEEPKPEVKNNTTVITPVKPKEVVKEKTAAEKLADKFKKNTGKTGGGKGDNEEAGQSGSPNGDPFKNGTGGHGTGDGGGDGEGTGPGSGPGFGGGRGGGFGASLAGRKVVTQPKLPSDTKEEGKVVVEITVDKDGNVIEANPNGRGTTTSSALLKAKAKQAAMQTRFNSNDRYEEQNGTITIIFSFD